MRWWRSLSGGRGGRTLFVTDPLVVAEAKVLFGPNGDATQRTITANRIKLLQAFKQAYALQQEAEMGEFGEDSYSRARQRGPLPPRSEWNVKPAMAPEFEVGAGHDNEEESYCVHELGRICYWYSAVNVEGRRIVRNCRCSY